MELHDDVLKDHDDVWIQGWSVQGLLDRVDET